MDAYHVREETQPHYNDLISAIDEDGHLTEDQLFGVKTMIFNIKTTPGITLAKLAADNVGAMIWEIPEDLKKFLRHVNKTDNRSHVTESDLEGDLNKGLFLGATVISQYSNAPIELACDIPGLVPNEITSYGRHNWTVPANCPFTMVNRNIFDPNDMFSKWMYEHNQKCDLKTLDEHIDLNYDKNKQFGVMQSHGVGWRVLKPNLAKPEFQQAMESIYSQNKHVFEEEHINHLVRVPYEICEAVKEKIAEPLRSIEARYTNFNTMHAKLTRADKEPWDSIKGLAVDSIIYGEENVGYEMDQKLNQPFEAGLKLECKFILN